MAKKIGFIGLGQMGRWMAGNLAKAGHPLTLLNGRPERRALVEELGATGVSTAAEMAAATDIIFLSLPDTDVVKDVLLSPGGCMLATIQPRRDPDAVQSNFLPCVFLRPLDNFPIVIWHLAWSGLYHLFSHQARNFQASTEKNMAMQAPDFAFPWNVPKDGLKTSNTVSTFF